VTANVAGRREELGHTLIPLALAAGVVRKKVYDDRRVTTGGLEGDLNMLACFVAAMIPLYEYPPEPSGPARALNRSEVEGGVFRNGGRELRFINGRPAKYNLAVSANDIAAIVALLKDPEHSTRILSRFARRRAQEAKVWSERLIEQATELRREARQLVVHARAAYSDSSSEAPVAAAARKVSATAPADRAIAATPRLT